MGLLPLARVLRKNATDAEIRLWRELRAKRFQDHKFRRQQPIDSYIVDFVCLEARLIVEVDGGQHLEKQEQDRIRDGHLSSRGFKVLRFWNNEILTNMEGVLRRIAELLTPSPQPSPARGEGVSERRPK